MKKAAPKARNLIRAKAIIARLPYDSEQRDSAFRALVEQGEAAIAKFVSDGDKLLEKVAGLNGRMAAVRLSRGVKSSVRRSRTTSARRTRELTPAR